MELYNAFEFKCPKCGTKFKVDCDTCGYGIDDGWCKWNMEHHDDPCTSERYRWKPKKMSKEEIMEEIMIKVRMDRFKLGMSEEEYNKYINYTNLNYDWQKKYKEILNDEEKYNKYSRLKEKLK